MLSIHRLPKKVSDRCIYGDAIAVISSDNPKINKKFIFLKNDPDYNDDNLTELKFEKGTKLFPVPLRKTTSRLYVSGASGSGKSTYSSKWIQEYHRIFPSDKVYLISTVEEDEVLDKLDYIERVEIDEDLATIPLDEFQDSLVVFDDTNTISDKATRKAVSRLRDQLLERGRHHNASCLITSHLFSNFSDTRLTLLESRDITLFPRMGGMTQARRGLKTYVGMSDKQIDKAFKLKSRWITIRKTAPNFVLSERDCYLLD